MQRGYITPTESFVIRNTILELADIAPTIVIPGNHDMSNRYDRVDAVTGLLGRLRDESPTIHDRLRLSVRPESFVLPGVDATRFYTLPHPTKYFYLSQETETDPSEVNVVLTKAMEQIILGHATEANNQPSGWSQILIGHGTINGGIADSEAVMTNENDLAIDRKWLPDMTAVMYGHLHKRQAVGAGFYCGAIAPLTYAQQNMVPSFELWEFPGGEEPPRHYPMEIPVAHQMLTAEIGMDKFSNVNDDPFDIVVKTLEPLAVKNAKVRVRIEISRERESLVNRKRIEEYLDRADVHSHKVVIDPVDPLRVRADSMTQESGMDNMLETWAEMDPDRAGSLDMMKKIDKEVTATIPPEEMFKLAGIDYRLKRIRARNFKPLVDIDIVFEKLGKVICIIGDNHIGKSQIAEVERFGLWKILRPGTLLSDAVRIGTNSTEVILDFVAIKDGNEVERQVKRTLKLNNKGIASSDLIFSEKKGEGYVPLNEGTAGETQTAIEKLVGTYSMYENTRFGSQSDIDLLCGKSPAEMKDAMQESMNFTQFDLKQTAAEKGLKEIRGKYENATMNMESLQEQVSGEDDLRKQIEQSEEMKITKDNEINGLQKQIAEITVKIDSISDTKEEAGRLNALISEKTRLLDAEERAITDAKAILGQAYAAKHGLEEIKRLSALVDETRNKMTALSTRMQADGQKLRELNTRSRSFGDANNKFIQDMASLQREINQVQTEHDAKITRCENDLKRTNETAALIDTVPCADMDINSQCDLLANAHKAREEATTLQTALDNYRSGAPDTSEIEERKRTMATEQEDMLKSAGEVDAAITEIEPRHKADQDEYDRIGKNGKIDEDNLKQFRSMNYEEVQEKILVADTEIKNATENINRIDAEKKEAAIQYEKITKDSTDPAMLNTQVDSLRSNLRGVQSQQDQAVRQIGALEQNLKRVEDVKKEIVELQEAHSTGLARINAYVHYLAAVSRDGIPYLLMEKALPQFEQYANEFLCVDEGFEATLRVHIAATKDTQDGREKNEPVITFIDELGQHPLGESSGFQRVAIGYALRAAMAKIQAQSTGITIRHCIFDEGWGAFKENNYGLAQSMIRKLGQEFGQFFYITHIPALQEIADTVIMVNAVDGGAEITIK